MEYKLWNNRKRSSLNKLSMGIFLISSLRNFKYLSVKQYSVLEDRIKINTNTWINKSGRILEKQASQNGNWWVLKVLFLPLIKMRGHNKKLISTMLNIKTV